MIELSEFRPYLQSILDSSEGEGDWGDRYISTQAELPLRVQNYKAPSTELEQAQSEKRKQQKSFAAVEELRLYAPKQVLLLGKPGSGKSTALRRLQYEEAERCVKAIEQHQSEIPQIPVLIELGNLKDSVFKAIQERLKWWVDIDEQVLRVLLRKKQFLVLLDGLNELPTKEAWQEVNEFKKICDSLRFSLIITTREVGVGAPLNIQKKLEILPLAPMQIDKFVKKQLPETGEKLLGQLKDRLRELAERPLFLKILCEVFKENEEIPNNRGDLFHKEFSRRYQEFKPERPLHITEESRHFAFDLLCYLAFRMTEGEPHPHPSQPTPSWTTISKTVAVELFISFLNDYHNSNISKVTASEWLEDLLKWHLLQVANDSEYIEFPHQLFQEYYAGEWLLILIKKKNITEDQLKHIYLNYLKWTESISFSISRLNHQAIVVQIVELSLDVTPKLGARLISEAKLEFQRSLIDLILQRQFSRRIKIYLLGIARSDAAILYLNEELRKASKFFDSSYRASLSADADEIERMKILYFPELLEGWKEDSSIRSLIVSTLGEIGTINAVNLLLKELGRVFTVDENCEEIRLEDIQKRIFNTTDLINALRHHIHNENVCDLITQALKSGNPYIQEAAILVLSKSTYEKTISALISTLDSNNRSVRYRAADALGIIGSKISIPALMDVALYDEDIGTRRAAIEGLQKINSDIPITHWIDALKDNNVHVRKNAVQALGEYGDDKAVLHLINALDEGDPNIFTDIIFALGEIGSQEAISTLKEISLTNSNIRNRLACIWSLSKIGEEAIPVLTLHLDSDDIQVRQRVTDALESIGGEKVIPILEKILVENIENCVSIFADSAINKVKAKLYGAEQECIRQCQDEMHRWNDFYHGPDKISKSHEEMNHPLSSEHLLTTIHWIQERYQFYNYEIVQARFHDINHLKTWLRKLLPIRLFVIFSRYISKGEKNVTNNFNFDQRGANIGVNVASEGSNIQFIQHAKQNINFSEQDLAEATKKIEALLTQLAQTYPTTTEPQQRIFFQNFLDLIESTPDLIKILLAGGIEGLKMLCPPAGIPVEMARRLYEAVQQRNSQL